jgi:hypothetical protein
MALSPGRPRSSNHKISCRASTLISAPPRLLDAFKHVHFNSLLPKVGLTTSTLQFRVILSPYCSSRLICASAVKLKIEHSYLLISISTAVVQSNLDHLPTSIINSSQPAQFSAQHLHSNIPDKHERLSAYADVAGKGGPTSSVQRQSTLASGGPQMPLEVLICSTPEHIYT